MPDCRTCGVSLPPGTTICTECGEQVTGATESFPAIELEGEALDRSTFLEQGPVLIVRKGPQTGERFYVERPRLTIGRDPSSDIFLNDMTVSRSHAALELVGGVVTVHDDGSLNGTYVNGVCVDVATLEDGDVLQVGTFQMVFVTESGS